MSGRRLPGVGRPARAEAGDGAALPAFVGTPAEHRPGHPAQCPGRRAAPP